MVPQRAFTRGDVIRRRRENMRLTQAGLANLAKHGVASVRRLEQDKAGQKAGTVEDILRALKTTMDQIDLERAALNTAVCSDANSVIVAHQNVGGTSERAKDGVDPALPSVRLPNGQEDTVADNDYPALTFYLLKGLPVQEQRKWYLSLLGSFGVHAPPESSVKEGP